MRAYWSVGRLTLALLVPLEGGSVELPDGFWRSDGYGEVLEIRSESFRHFEITEISCLDRGTKPRANLTELIGTAISESGNALSDRSSVTVRRGISQYVWRRLEELPDQCVSPHERTDPRTLFNILWHAFNEHYAFFEMRRVDWAATRRRFESRISEHTDDEALFSMLSEMLGQLQDQHVRLRAGDRLFVSGRRGSLEPDPDGLLPQHSSLQPALKSFLAASVLTEGLKTTANDRVWWGRLDGNVSYIALKSLWDFTGRAETHQDAESAAAEAAMDEVLEDLITSRGIIIDLRFNNGGSDAVGLTIAGRFADKARVAFTKQAVHNKRLTPPYEVSVLSSARTRFAGPVIALIGPLTASAAEVMTLGLMALPNVTLLGGRTRGLFSDTLYRQLPNGWTFTVSNEIYRTPFGELFEGSGIPPHLWSTTPNRPSTADERFGRDIRIARDLIDKGIPARSN